MSPRKILFIAALGRMSSAPCGSCGARKAMEYRPGPHRRDGILRGRPSFRAPERKFRSPRLSRDRQDRRSERASGFRRSRLPRVSRGPWKARAGAASQQANPAHADHPQTKTTPLTFSAARSITPGWTPSARRMNSRYSPPAARLRPAQHAGCQSLARPLPRVAEENRRPVISRGTQN